MLRAWRSVRAFAGGVPSSVFTTRALPLYLHSAPLLHGISAAASPILHPRASLQDLQIDPERPVRFDRSPVPGRKPEPVLERRCANKGVVDRTPGDTGPGKTGEELLGRCRPQEARRWEAARQQDLGRLRRAPEGWWQPGDH